MISKRSLFVKRRIKLSIGLTFDGSKLLRRSLSTNNTDPFQRNQGDDNSGVGGVLRRQKETFYKKMNEFNSKYEDFIGLADVQLAQSRVKEVKLFEVITLCQVMKHIYIYKVIADNTHTSFFTV